MSSYAIMTNVGRNKEAAALANGTALTITHIAWGDGDRAPSGGETSLLNEQGRKVVQGNGQVTGALNTAFFQVGLDANEGPFVIRESGLFDGDGDLIAITKYDPPVNKPKDTVSALLRIHVVFSDLQNLVLQVQSTDAFVPAERLIATGDGLTGGGDMTANRSLAVDFATEGQALAGTSAKKVLSPVSGAALLAIAAPVGGEMFFAGNAPPTGWLEEDRSAISRTSYAKLWAHAQASGMYDATGANIYMFGPGDGATTFDLPESRGEFLRGWDHGRGADTGRALGTFQDHAFQDHKHWITGSVSGNVQAVRMFIQANTDNPNQVTTAGSWGDDIAEIGQARTGNPASETRPRNVTRMFCIKF